MASGATPPASPQDSFSAWAAPDNEQAREAVLQVMDDMRAADVDFLTIG
jgi:hypothetical protein